MKALAGLPAIIEQLPSKPPMLGSPVICVSHNMQVSCPGYKVCSRRW